MGQSQHGPGELEEGGRVVGRTGTALGSAASAQSCCTLTRTANTQTRGDSAETAPATVKERRGGQSERRVDRAAERGGRSGRAAAVMPCHLSAVTAPCREFQPTAAGPLWPQPVLSSSLCVDACQRGRWRRHSDDTTAIRDDASRPSAPRCRRCRSPAGVFLAQQPMPVAVWDLSCFYVAAKRRGDDVHVIHLTLLAPATTRHGRHGMSRHVTRLVTG